MELREYYLIVGTSHISKESLTKIKHSFARFKPGIICVELDRARMQALMENKGGPPSIRSITRIGFTGYLFALIGGIIQRKIGGLVGMNPGREMLLASNLAKNNCLTLALIDQDASVTLRNLSKNVSLREKLKLVFSILAAPFSKKRKVKVDLSRIPSEQFIDMITAELKSAYPGIYKALIADRDMYMAKKVFRIIRDNPEKKVMVVVGAGHIKGMEKCLGEIMASNIY